MSSAKEVDDASESTAPFESSFSMGSTEEINEASGWKKAGSAAESSQVVNSVDFESNAESRGRAVSLPTTLDDDKGLGASAETGHDAVVRRHSGASVMKNVSDTPAEKPWAPRPGSKNFLSLPRELRDIIYEEWIRSVHIIHVHSRHNPYPTSLFATRHGLALVHTHPDIRADFMQMLPILSVIHMTVDVKSRTEGRRVHPFLTCADVAGVLEKLFTPTLIVHMTSFVPEDAVDFKRDEYKSPKNKRELQLRRMEELPAAVEWAHKLFMSMNTIVFEGDMGRERVLSRRKEPLVQLGAEHNINDIDPVEHKKRLAKPPQIVDFAAHEQFEEMMQMIKHEGRIKKVQFVKGFFQEVDSEMEKAIVESLSGTYGNEGKIEFEILDELLIHDAFDPTVEPVKYLGDKGKGKAVAEAE